MSDGPTPYPRTAPVPSPAARPSRRPWAWLTAGLLVGAGVTFGIMTAAAPGAQPSGPAPAAPSATETTSAAPFVPPAADFTITVQVLSKECFGSAGCNVTYRISPKYAGPALDQDQKYTVTYQLLGAQDGTKIGSFTILGGQANVDTEDQAQIGSGGDTLTAQATNVLVG